MVKGSFGGSRERWNERDRERERAVPSIPWKSVVEANESEELTVERTGQDREREN